MQSIYGFFISWCPSWSCRHFPDVVSSYIRIRVLPRHHTVRRSWVTEAPRRCSNFILSRWLRKEPRISHHLVCIRYIRGDIGGSCPRRRTSHRHYSTGFVRSCQTYPTRPSISDRVTRDASIIHIVARSWVHWYHLTSRHVLSYNQLLISMNNSMIAPTPGMTSCGKFHIPGPCNGAVAKWWYMWHAGRNPAFSDHGHAPRLRLSIWDLPSRKGEYADTLSLWWCIASEGVDGAVKNQMSWV